MGGLGLSFFFGGGASLTLFGASLGPLGARMGPSWGPPGPSWDPGAVLGSSGAVLGPSDAVWEFFKEQDSSERQCIVYACTFGQMLYA